MLTLKTLLSLSIDTLIQARVSAYNSNGWGSTSQINTSGATIESTPGTMSAVTYDSSLALNTQIGLVFTALTSASDKGGSSVSITNYEI